ncbi:MAG TPA: hypothetical protein EYO88_10855, partial [Alphaproteobacteria bacterium]|nr:hypothetical protein [Alphaproteobacteria bacterium]
MKSMAMAMAMRRLCRIAFVGSGEVGLAAERVLLVALPLPSPGAAGTRPLLQGSKRGKRLPTWA